jgi:hypothetical protein
MILWIDTRCNFTVGRLVVRLLTGIISGVDWPPLFFWRKVIVTATIFPCTTKCHKKNFIVVNMLTPDDDDDGNDVFGGNDDLDNDSTTTTTAAAATIARTGKIRKMPDTSAMKEAVSILSKWKESGKILTVFKKFDYSSGSDDDDDDDDDDDNNNHNHNHNNNGNNWDLFFNGLSFEEENDCFLLAGLNASKQSIHSTVYDNREDCRPMNTAAPDINTHTVTSMTDDANENNTAFSASSSSSTTATAATAATAATDNNNNNNTIITNSNTDNVETGNISHTSNFTRSNVSRRRVAIKHDHFDYLNMKPVPFNNIKKPTNISTAAIKINKNSTAYTTVANHNNDRTDDTIFNIRSSSPMTLSLLALDDYNCCSNVQQRAVSLSSSPSISSLKRMGSSAKLSTTNNNVEFLNPYKSLKKEKGKSIDDFEHLLTGS